MSHDFTLILPAPTITLIDAVYFIERGLAEIGYNHGQTISRIDMSDAPGLSTHTEMDVPFTASQQGGIAGWRALVMEFFSDALTVDISIVQWDQENTNIYADVNANLLWRKPRIDHFKLFISTVLRIAQSIRAPGGVGGYRFDLNRIDQDMLFATITNNPVNTGFPSEVGLVKVSAMDEPAIHAMVDGFFKIEVHDDYWLLLANDFVRLLESD